MLQQLKPLVNWLTEWQRAREQNPGQMLLLVGLLLVVIQISPYWYPTRDGAEYVSVARSIGTEAEFLNYGSPRTKIPPVYPLAISPAWWTGERPWLVVSSIQSLWGLAFLAGCWWWFRRLIPDHAVLLTGITCANASLWYYYARTLKEVLFLALLMATVWAMHRLVEAVDAAEKRSSRRIVGWGLLATTFFTALCLTRYPAIVLSGGLGLMLMQQAWRRKRGWWRPILIPLLVSLIPALALFVYLKWDHEMAAIHGHGTYAAAWQEAGRSFFSRFNESLIRRTEDFGRILLPGMFKSYGNEASWIDWNMLIYVPTIIVVFYGCWILFWERDDMLVGMFPFYLLLYLAWPYQQGSRFAIAVVPLAFACYWTGCQRLLRFGPGFLTVLFMLHLGVASCYWLFVDRPRAAEEHQYWSQVDELAARIPPEVLDEPSQIGVQRIPASLHSMLQVGLDYRVYSFKDHPTFYPEAAWMIQRTRYTKPAEFELIHSTGQFDLLKRTKPGGQLPPLPK